MEIYSRSENYTVEFEGLGSRHVIITEYTKSQNKVISIA